MTPKQPQGEAPRILSKHRQMLDQQAGATQKVRELHLVEAKRLRSVYEEAGSQQLATGRAVRLQANFIRGNTFDWEEAPQERGALAPRAPEAPNWREARDAAAKALHTELRRLGDIENALIVVAPGSEGPRLVLIGELGAWAARDWPALHADAQGRLTGPGEGRIDPSVLEPAQMWRIKSLDRSTRPLGERVLEELLRARLGWLKDAPRASELMDPATDLDSWLRRPQSSPALPSAALRLMPAGLSFALSANFLMIGGAQSTLPALVSALLVATILSGVTLLSSSAAGLRGYPLLPTLLSSAALGLTAGLLQGPGWGLLISVLMAGAPEWNARVGRWLIERGLNGRRLRQARRLGRTHTALGEALSLQTVTPLDTVSEQTLRPPLLSGAELPGGLLRHWHLDFGASLGARLRQSDPLAPRRGPKATAAERRLLRQQTGRELSRGLRQLDAHEVQLAFIPPLPPVITPPAGPAQIGAGTSRASTLRLLSHQARAMTQPPSLLEEE